MVEHAEESADDHEESQPLSSDPYGDAPVFDSGEHGLAGRGDGPPGEAPVSGGYPGESRGPDDDLNLPTGLYDSQGHRIESGDEPRRVATRNSLIVTVVGLAVLILGVVLVVGISANNDSADPASRSQTPIPPPPGPSLSPSAGRPEDVPTKAPEMRPVERVRLRSTVDRFMSYAKPGHCKQAWSMLDPYLRRTTYRSRATIFCHSDYVLMHYMGRLRHCEAEGSSRLQCDFRGYNYVSVERDLQGRPIITSLDVRG